MAGSVYWYILQMAPAIYDNIFILEIVVSTCDMYIVVSYQESRTVSLQHYSNSQLLATLWFYGSQNFQLFDFPIF